MKFLVPNCSCLQNPWLRGYRPQIPVLSALCPQLNLLNPPPEKKIPGCATELTSRLHTVPGLTKCKDALTPALPPIRRCNTVTFRSSCTGTHSLYSGSAWQLIQLNLELTMLLRITCDSQRHVCLADTCRLASTNKKQSAYFIARHIATYTVHKVDKSRLNSGNAC